MNTQENSVFTPKKRKALVFGQMSLAILAALASISIILLVKSQIDLPVKIFVSLVIFSLFVAVCFVFYSGRKKNSAGAGEIRKQESTGKPEKWLTDFDVEVESRLFALEETREFFGASLKPADMFRLVSSRINELVPFAACALFLADREESNLKIKFADGENAALLKNLIVGFEQGNAGKTLLEKKARLDEGLSLEREALPAILLENYTSVLAVPLVRGDEAFGVLQLYGDAEKSFDEKSLALLEAIGERVAPLFLSSISFEQSLSNALTDALTNLPNERAFFLVLENQIAEAQRYREDRPLTILSIDIKNFAELNQRFGHALGDRLLKYAGEVIKNQLRQMDFIARSVSDEFLIVLPTASEKTTLEVAERIRRFFVSRPFEILVEEKIFLSFNFGLASFGRDGETAQQLLQTAVWRKKQGKTNEPGKILWFSKELVG